MTCEGILILRYLRAWNWVIKCLSISYVNQSSVYKREKLDTVLPTLSTGRLLCVKFWDSEIGTKIRDDTHPRPSFQMIYFSHFHNSHVYARSCAMKWMQKEIWGKKIKKSINLLTSWNNWAFWLLLVLFMPNSNRKEIWIFEIFNASFHSLMELTTTWLRYDMRLCSVERGACISANFVNLNYRHVTFLPELNTRSFALNHTCAH